MNCSQLVMVVNLIAKEIDMVPEWATHKTVVAGKERFFDSEEAAIASSTESYCMPEVVKIDHDCTCNQLPSLY